MYSVLEGAQVCSVWKTPGHRLFQWCPLVHGRDVDGWVLVGDRMSAA